MRCERGSLKYVQTSADGMFYDVNYWNARLHKSIPLGRFTDPLTASLAHAITRDAKADFDFQLRPFAAQEYISCVLAVPNAENLSENDELSHVLRENKMCLDSEDGLDFDSLFAMTQ